MEVEVEVESLEEVAVEEPSWMVEQVLAGS